jgi:gamma-glutamyltranspeptidase/glutathione hydrolase
MRIQSIMKPWPLGLVAALLFACGASKTSPPVAAPVPATPTALPTAPPTAPPTGPIARAPEPVIPAAWPHHETAATAAHAMVATDSEEATRVGAAVLAAGGNAVDAAVAVAFALAVVYPEAGNIGGGGFIVARMGKRTSALDFRETAPARATHDMYLDESGKLRDDASLTGDLAAGVPGSVAGLWEAHHKLGSRPWKELLAPAIQLAADGFEVEPAVAQSIAGEKDRLLKFPASAALYLPGGVPLAAGAHAKNPDLAAVLRRVAAEGPAGFYRGKTADLIVAEMKRGHGLISKADLAGYKPHWREPLEFDYRGFHVASMPPPSSGGVALAMIAHLIEPMDLGAWHSPHELHVLIEAMRRAFAARNAYLGDPDFVKNPIDTLLSTEWAEKQRATIVENQATPSAEVSPGVDSGGGGKHTTHFSVVDAKGDAVALTTTINTGFGAAVTVPGAGFLLNNEMDDFAAKPGEKNTFGLVQGESNSIAPGKRMLSSMAPTIVTGPDGKVVLVTGASGGPTIITATWQVISNVVDYRMGIAEAVSAPRVHHQHLPDVAIFEADGVNAETQAALKAMGHTLRAARGGSIGDAPSILRVADGWSGAREPRRGGGLAAGN